MQTSSFKSATITLLLITGLITKRINLRQLSLRCVGGTLGVATLVW